MNATRNCVQFGSLRLLSLMLDPICLGKNGMDTYELTCCPRKPSMFHGPLSFTRKHVNAHPVDSKDVPTQLWTGWEELFRGLHEKADSRAGCAGVSVPV